MLDIDDDDVTRVGWERISDSVAKNGTIQDLLSIVEEEEEAAAAASITAAFLVVSPNAGILFSLLE